jgi:hypothetical protein
MRIIGGLTRRSSLRRYWRRRNSFIYTKHIYTLFTSWADYSSIIFYFLPDVKNKNAKLAAREAIKRKILSLINSLTRNYCIATEFGIEIWIFGNCRQIKKISSERCFTLKITLNRFFVLYTAPSTVLRTILLSCKNIRVSDTHQINMELCTIYFVGEIIWWAQNECSQLDGAASQMGEILSQKRVFLLTPRFALFSL